MFQPKMGISGEDTIFFDFYKILRNYTFCSIIGIFGKLKFLKFYLLRRFKKDLFSIF